MRSRIAWISLILFLSGPAATAQSRLNKAGNKADPWAVASVKPLTERERTHLEIAKLQSQVKTLKLALMKMEEQILSLQAANKENTASTPPWEAYQQQQQQQRIKIANLATAPILSRYCAKDGAAFTAKATALATATDPPQTQAWTNDFLSAGVMQNAGCTIAVDRALVTLIGYLGGN